MSFGDTLPVPEAMPLGISTDQTVNFQYGNPIPYLAGKRRLAPTSTWTFLPSRTKLIVGTVRSLTSSKYAPQRKERRG